MHAQPRLKRAISFATASLCAGVIASASGETGQTESTHQDANVSKQSGYPEKTADKIEYLRGLGVINVRIGKNGVRYEINQRNAEKLISDPELRQIYLSLQEAMAKERQPANEESGLE